jgi:hypothetical protein
MARQQIKNYVFTPGTAGLGTIKLSGNYDQSDILTVLNSTDQVFIYNFADPALGGTVVWSAAADSDFPQAQDGITTITLDISTSTMSANDSLAIYVETESQNFRPWEFGTDAVERMRVAAPQSLIDADFEYGLQNTKWQSLFLNNDVPSLYELPGSELTANVNGYATFIGVTPITGTGTTSITLTNQGTAGIGTGSPQWVDQDRALIVNPYVTGANVVTWTTASASSSNQRALTVASTTGFTNGDSVVIVYLPATSSTTVSTNITSGATTTLAVASGTGLVNGSMLMVQTNTTNVWELMTVTSGGGGGSLTVSRRRLNTNQGNININTGNAVRLVSNVEIGLLSSVDSSTQISVNRGWMNTVAASDLSAGSVIHKLNFDPLTGSGANVELANITTVSTSINGSQTIARAASGTTAIASAPVGSIVVRMAGVYQAGSTNIPLVGMNVWQNGHSTGQFTSTTNHASSNTEGLYQLTLADANNMFYYPRRTTNLNIGYQLNKYDTQIRKAALFTGAAIPLTSIATDGNTPSTITVTTPYAHGITPGTPIIVNLNAGTNPEYGTGSFVVLTVPSTTTFTYQGKAGGALTGSPAGSIYIRPSAFFIHRPFDGGVLLGSGTPHHGATAARQSKKYFRYQSGKGLMWTSGTLLSTNFDIANITADGTTALSSNVSITTEYEHYLQAGANVLLSGITTGGYDNFYNVSSVTSDTTFVVTAKATLDSTTPVLSPQPKINVCNWHGGCVRAGIFDEQNGAFWEYTGTNLNVVLRSATFQATGFVSLQVGSSLVTGDGNCRFAEQLTKYDRVVIRGMSHIVTGITDNNTMTVSPQWRGVSNQTRVKMGRVSEVRVPQNEFNRDRLDGTGPSGYKIDVAKMQMLMIQYTWYGAGFVEFGVRGPNGTMIIAHRIQNNNVNDEAYMRSGNLPVRYAANNETPGSKLAATIDGSATTLTLEDGRQFPPATVANPVYIIIDNEVIKYSSKPSVNELGNLTRASSFTLWQEGSSKSFSMGTAASHTEGTGVRVLSCTSAPALNHWGSAVIMDGGFDEDRGYSFTYSAGNIAFPTGTSVRTAFAMRLTPAVSNTIIGDLGTRDLINRAQLILNDMVVNFTGANARFLIEGILNPTNITSSTTSWLNLNTSTNGFQPSFTQFASNTGITFSSVPWATGGERLFAIPVNSTNSGTLDLSRVKQIVTSAIPGNGVYPDGPELLAINITSLTTTGGGTQGDIQISFTESQA